MKYLNTPDAQFENLSTYTFSPNYYTYSNGMRMHYLDEGPADAKETMLLLHGEPSWSYLYRKMIPVFVAAGYRCIAPDLIGFGKSSKPTETADYTYSTHVAWTLEWFDSMNVSGLTFFGQDWGGLVGLRLVAARPDAFARCVIGNTGLPTGDRGASEAFLKWQKFSQQVEVFPIEMVMQGATVNELSAAEIAAYKAPFPDDSYMAGARIFPALVPTTPDDPESENNRKAWSEVFMKWEKPFLTLFSDSDAVTKGGEAPWQKLVPGAKGQPHEIIVKAGHFLQEDKGAEIAEKIVTWMG